MSMNTIHFCVCFSAIPIGLWRMNIGPEEPLDFPFEHQEDGAQAVASQHIASELHGSENSETVCYCVSFSEKRTER